MAVAVDAGPLPLPAADADCLMTIECAVMYAASLACVEFAS
jgi:hypothetical protein